MSAGLRRLLCGRCSRVVLEPAARGACACGAGGGGMLAGFITRRGSVRTGGDGGASGVSLLCCGTSAESTAQSERRWPLRRREEQPVLRLSRLGMLSPASVFAPCVGGRHLRCGCGLGFRCRVGQFCRCCLGRLRLFSGLGYLVTHAKKIVLVFFSPLACLSAQAKLPENQASGALAAPAVVLGIRQIQLEVINKKSNAETLKCQGFGAKND